MDPLGGALNLGRFLFLHITLCLFGQLTWASATPTLVTHPSLQPEADLIVGRLPDQLLQTIGKTIRIEFSKLDGNPQAYFGCEVPKPTKPVVAAKILPTATQTKVPIIYVHRGYFELLKNKPNEIRCGKTIREHFQRAIVHEMAHLFDLHAPRFAQEVIFAKNNCKQNNSSKTPKSARVAQNAELCRNIERKFRYSESAQYLSLDNWVDQRHTKNTETQLAVDPYAFVAARESFAVNFEAYITDQNFACHKPALANYFSTILKHNNVCPYINSNVISRNEIYNLDPDRLYEVHYLYAAPGNSVPSRWGHAMLRLVYCSPERPLPSADCLKDVSYHRVVSFRANIEDFQLNNWKALTGKYPSQMFILNLNEVVNEYTQVELRDVISLPLQLTALEKRLLIEKILESYWDYKGRYYFLSNNCADETFALLSGIFFDDRAFEIQKFMFREARLITPKELYLFFQQIGLTKQMPSQRHDRLALGYEFTSGTESLEKAYSLLAHRAPTVFQKQNDYVTYLSTTTASQRQRLFYDSLESSPIDQRAFAASFYILESNQYGRLQSQARKELAKLIESGNSEIIALTEQIKNDYLNTFEKQAHEKMPSNYGVPLITDWEKWVSRLPAQSNDLNEFDAQRNPELIALLQKLIPDLLSEITQSQNNLSLFLNYIKQTKQQTKGEI
jgi:hypothetical protein